MAQVAVHQSHDPVADQRRYFPLHRSFTEFSQAYRSAEAYAGAGFTVSMISATGGIDGLRAARPAGRRRSTTNRGRNEPGRDTRGDRQRPTQRGRPEIEERVDSRGTGSARQRSRSSVFPASRPRAEKDDPLRQGAKHTEMAPVWWLFPGVFRVATHSVAKKQGKNASECGKPPKLFLDFFPGNRQNEPQEPWSESSRGWGN